MAAEEPQGPAELALIGNIDDHEADVTEKLLAVPPGDECVIYFDSPGGNPYAGMSLMTLILVRGLRATGIVTGECSSAALWPLAACHRRLVTPYSVLLFHPMRWQSEENVRVNEASEWARHFGLLETEMDRLLARLLGVSYEAVAAWMTPGRYVSGSEFAGAGLAELIDLAAVDALKPPRPSAKKRARDR